MTQQLASKQRCPRCGKKAILNDTGIAELICGRCGYVISEGLEDSGPEWRSFPDDKTNKTRTGVGISLTIHDYGLATIINPINRDSVGKPLPYSMKRLSSVLEYGIVEAKLTNLLIETFDRP